MKNLENHTKEQRIKHILKEAQGRIKEGEEEEFCKYVVAGYMHLFDDEHYPNEKVENKK